MPETEQEVYSVGDSVVLRKLIKAEKYNGQFATIYKAYNHVTGRYGVKLLDGKKLAVRPTHIVPASEVKKKKEDPLKTDTTDKKIKQRIYSVGERVEADFMDVGTYYSGKIQAVTYDAMKGKTYTISYDDGDLEKNVDQKRVREPPFNPYAPQWGDEHEELEQENKWESIEDREERECRERVNAMQKEINAIESEMKIAADKGDWRASGKLQEKLNAKNKELESENTFFVKKEEKEDRRKKNLEEKRRTAVRIKNEREREKKGIKTRRYYIMKCSEYDCECRDAIPTDPSSGSKICRCGHSLSGHHIEEKEEEQQIDITSSDDSSDDSSDMPNLDNTYRNQDEKENKFSMGPDYSSEEDENKPFYAADYDKEPDVDQERRDMNYLWIGTHVKIKGLKGNNHYNGMIGVIKKEYDNTNGRYQVEVKNSGQVIAIKPRNLDLLSKSYEANLTYCEVDGCECHNSIPDAIYQDICTCGHALALHKTKKSKNKKNSINSNLDKMKIYRTQKPTVRKNTIGQIKVRFKPGEMGITFHKNRITEVFPGGQGEELGIQVGWKILEVNGAKMINETKIIDDAINTTYLHSLSTEILFRKEIKITFKPKKIGLRFDGNIIRKVKSDYQAARLGVKANWTVLYINGKKMPNQKAVIKRTISEAIALETSIDIIFAPYRVTKQVKKENKKTRDYKRPSHLDEDQWMPKDKRPNVDGFNPYAMTNSILDEEHLRKTGKYRFLQDMEALSVGTIVIIKDLQGAAQFNGKRGRIEKEYSIKKSRYTVKILDSEKLISLQPKNIELIQEELKPEPIKDRVIDHQKRFLFEPSKLGLKFEGNSVRRVIAGYQGARFGVREGWRVHSLNGDKVTKKTFKKALHVAKKTKKPMAFVFVPHKLQTVKRFCEERHEMIFCKNPKELGCVICYDYIKAGTELMYCRICQRGRCEKCVVSGKDEYELKKRHAEELRSCW